MKVYVAGLGVVSGLGVGVKSNFDALISKNHGIRSLSNEIDPFLENFPIARLNLNDRALSKLAGVRTRVPRTALLSMIAAAEAVNHSGLSMQQYRSGFISATTVGGMDLTEQYFLSQHKGGNKLGIRNIRNHECGRATHLAAEYLKVNSYVSTINTACSSSANSIMLGARLIKDNRLDVVIAGGADALTSFTLNGFNTLLLLDNELNKPFDAQRKGLNLGEGAGYVVLVSEKLVQSGQVKPFAVLSGYANTTDAYHQTALSPDGNGPFLSMSGALKVAQINPNQVDYINLHGTATPNNDASEGTAITRLFKDRLPSVSSTKSFTGHTLGASGGIEAVYSILAINHGVILPNLRYTTPMTEVEITPAADVEYKPVNHVLSNSFGFGGNCTSLLISKVS